MRLICLLLLLLLVAGAAGNLLRSPGRYLAQDREAIAAGSSPTHLAGTDELGRDRLARISVALLLGLAGSGLASTVASVAAVLIGGSAAFAPRWLGKLVLFAGDLFLTLPWLFLLMLVRSALPLNLAPAHSAELTFLLLAILSIPASLRLNFQKLSTLKRADWFLHARAGGLRRHQVAQQLLPHMLPILLTQFLLYIPACLMAEADLGTLGLGVGEPLPSWGSMLGGLQTAALVSSSRLIYLPLLLLAVVLFALEMLTLERRA